MLAMKVVGLLFIAIEMVVSLTIDEIDANYALWQTNGYTDYIFQYTETCFCFECAVYEKTITVVSSVITLVEYTNEDEALSCENFDFLLSPTSFETINELFELLYENIDTAYEISATFDDEFGYPITGYIDFEEMLADDEKIWTISTVINTNNNNNNNGTNTNNTDTSSSPDITKTCDNGKESLLSMDRFYSCDDIYGSDESGNSKYAGSVCGMFESASDDNDNIDNLIIIYDTEGSEFNMEQISMHIDDESETYLINRRGKIAYNRLEYQSTCISCNENTCYYTFTIPLSTFQTLNNICEYCTNNNNTNNTNTIQNEFSNILYLTSRVALYGDNIKTHYSYIDMELHSSIECSIPALQS